MSGVLPPIPGLDPGIAPWVEILRNHGVETYESCQGGPDPDRPARGGHAGGHAYPEPTIAFHGGPAAGTKAYSIAKQHGMPISELRRVWKEEDHELVGPKWEIVFRRQATAQEAIDAAEVLEFEASYMHLGAGATA